MVQPRYYSRPPERICTQPFSLVISDPGPRSASIATPCGQLDCHNFPPQPPSLGYRELALLRHTDHLTQTSCLPGTAHPISFVNWWPDCRVLFSDEAHHGSSQGFCLTCLRSCLRCASGCVLPKSGCTRPFTPTTHSFNTTSTRCLPSLHNKREPVLLRHTLTG